MPTRVINISNRLPVTVGDKITKSSGGLVAALEGLSADEYELTWIGWPGGAIEDPARQEEVERVLSEEHGCLPVFLSEEEVAGHYEGFSNSSVWPLLHYMPNYMRYDPAWWDHYHTANQRFADKVLEMAQPGDLVWVHDYQLMLMPQMLHERMPELKIGFFLHTPFPSFETFRCHPKRRELVAGCSART
jgi:trehalose 6-phosphate synthase/phosphatase